MMRFVLLLVLGAALSYVALFVWNTFQAKRDLTAAGREKDAAGLSYFGFLAF